MCAGLVQSASVAGLAVVNAASVLLLLTVAFECCTMQVPYRLLKAYHKVQQRLVRELEKKFSGECGSNRLSWCNVY